MHDEFPPATPPTMPSAIPPASVDERVRNYAVFNHLIGLISFLGIPLGGLIGAIVMWQIKAGESGFINDHGREATNFQISLAIYTVAAVVFAVVTLGFGMLLSLPAILGIAVLDVIGCVQGAMAANRGQTYRYPLCIRFLKP